MINLSLSDEEINNEINRMLDFVSEKLSGEKAVIGVSGGLDSEFVTRISVRALGKDRVKVFIVRQEGLDPVHLKNARNLACELNLKLIEINLGSLPGVFLRTIKKADPDEDFCPNGLIDSSRIKCSFRTAIFSTYVDRGYVVIGTLNRTQYETGMTMPLGDGASHIFPIFHLYKSQLKDIAKKIGIKDEVIAQPASSGGWLGAEEIEDISYWLYYEKPIQNEVRFSIAENIIVQKIRKSLNTEKLDLALFGLSLDLSDENIACESGLPLNVVVRLRILTQSVKHIKHRPLGKSLTPSL